MIYGMAINFEHLFLALSNFKVHYLLKFILIQSQEIFQHDLSQEGIGRLSDI